MIDRVVIDADTYRKVVITTDVHGCYKKLMKILNDVDFCFRKDLLVLCGDNVDRGPDSFLMVHFVDQNDNVISVKGNHEYLTIDSNHHAFEKMLHIQNGGMWFYELTEQMRQDVRDVISNWPDVIELRRKGRVYGILHAEPDSSHWESVGQDIATITWGRDIVRGRGTINHVQGVERIFVGHSVLDEVKDVGNIRFMDLGVVFYNDRDLHYEVL